MWLRSVTFHLTQVNSPHLTPNRQASLQIYLPWRDGRLSWPEWLVTYQDGLPVHRQSKEYMRMTHPGKGKGKGNCIAVMEHHVTATECHLPYGITVLPAIRHKWTHPTFTPDRQADTRFTYPGGIEGWVDLGDLLHSTYPDGLPARRQPPIQVLTGPVPINFVDQANAANHYTDR